MKEQAKYEKLWGEHPEYRRVAPGEMLANHFLSLARPMPYQTVYDFGCGTGRGAARIAKRCKVVGIDFAENCLDADVSVEFLQHDLTQPLDLPLSDYGYCTDVLEHVEPENVDAVLSNILTAARRVYLNISTVQDDMGALIGEQLHLTVQPFDWWKAKLEALGARIDFEQDLDGISAIFYCSLYARFSDIDHKVALNVEPDAVLDNVRANLDFGLQEVRPHDAQDVEVMLLCGGPSLADFTDEIVAANKAGMPAITVNGAYNWLIEHGGRPGAQVIVDAREFNRRFTEPPVLQCKYLISSQCHPELVRSLPRSQTWLWHNMSDEIKAVIEDWSRGRQGAHEWYPVPGGTTVTLRALPLLAMLGFRRINVYGFDSCLRGDQHHAYEQAENDDMKTTEIMVGGRKFVCQGWMIKQADEFQAVLRHLLIPAGIELAVHGDGLIAAILETAAAAANEE